MTIRPDTLQDGDFPVRFGRFTLHRLLGEGGMARVFEAELEGNHGFRKRAAIKVIRRGISDETKLRAALVREARLGGLLSHPNVVETYDFGEVDGQAWIAMGLVEGIGLDRVLAPRRPLPADVALEVIGQICAGLDHAHSLVVDGKPAPLVHRDLKPSNVILSRSGLVKVLDFGIAKATHLTGQTTETGLTKGTPAYMSPEQAAGQKVDPRSDIFAAGALLFELLTGRRFFEGQTIFTIMMNIIKVEELIGRPGRLDMVDEALPGARDLVRRCLRSDRALRPPSAAALGAEVRALQGPTTPPGPIGDWLRSIEHTLPSIHAVPPTGPGADDIGPVGGGDDVSLGSIQEVPARLPEPPPPAALPDTVAATRLDEPGPTRLVDSTPPAGPSRAPWIVAGVGFLLMILAVALWPDRTPPEPPETSAVEVAPVDAADALTEAPPDVPEGTPMEVADAVPSAPAEAPREASPEPATPEVAPGEAATPVAKPREPTPPKAAATASLRHRSPEAAIIGGVTPLSARVEPPGACAPVVQWSPYEGSGGGSAPMEEVEAGVFEGEVRIPYALEWRSGFRYHVRCVAPDGRILARSPARGSHRVPALSR